MTLSKAETSLENKIKTYCIQNDLDFDLLANMKRNWGIDMLKFEKTEQGNPHVVLEVFGYGDNLTFKQTEYTKKYLAM